MSIPTMALGQGLRPFLLRHMRDIVGQGALPQTKIERLGFLNFLQSQQKPQVLRLNKSNGHRESVQVKYLQRYTEEFASKTEANVCNNTLFDPYHETSATLSSFNFIPMHLEDELIAQYEDDASAYVNAGKPATQLMNEMIERIMVMANAILAGMRTDLLTSLVTSGIGTNRVTGNNAAKTVNFPLNTTNLPLGSGINEILSDAWINLMNGTPQIIGSGLFNKYALMQYAKGEDQSGLNTALTTRGYDFFYEQGCANLLGADQILVVQPNAVQLVEYLQFTGFKAGVRPGKSIFGTIQLPMQMGENIIPIDFDYQLRYEDCPTTLVDNYYGTTTTIQKGFTLILSKKCGLFQIPSDAYRGTDPMVNNNGVLRYQITNV
jgi:hypothetical protein